MHKKFSVLFIFLVLSVFSFTPPATAYVTPSLAAENYVRTGKKFFHDKDYDRAIEQFNKALMADPYNEEAILYLRMLGFGMSCPKGSWACADQECGPACQDKAKKKEKGATTAKAGKSKKSKAVKQQQEQLDLEKKVVTEKMKKQAAQKEKELLAKQRAKAAKEEKEFLEQVQAGLEPNDLKDVQKKYKAKYGKKPPVSAEAQSGVKSTSEDDGFAVGVEADESISGQKGETTPATKTKSSSQSKSKAKSGSKPTTKTKTGKTKKSAAQKDEAVEGQEEVDESGFAVGVGTSESRYGEVGEGETPAKTTKKKSSSKSKKNLESSAGDESGDDGFAVGVGTSESRYGEVGEGETPAKTTKKKSSSKSKKNLGSSSGDESDDAGFAVGVGMSERLWSPEGTGTRSPALKKEYKGLDALIAKLQSLEEQKETLDQNKSMDKSKKAMAQKRLIRDINNTKADIKTAKADITKKEKALAKKAAASKKDKSAASAKKKTAAKKKPELSEEPAPAGEEEYYLEEDTEEMLEEGSGPTPAKHSGKSKKSTQSPKHASAKASEMSAEGEDAGMYAEGESPLEVAALADELAPVMTKQQKYQLAQLRAKHAQQEQQILEEFEDEMTATERKLNKKYDLEQFDEEPAAGSPKFKKKFSSDEEIAEEMDEVEAGAAPVQVKRSTKSGSKASGSGRGGKTALESENVALRKKLDNLMDVSKEDQDLIDQLQDQEVLTSGEKERLKSQLAKAQTQLSDRRGAIKDVGVKMKDLYGRVQDLENELNSRKYDFKDKQLDYEKKVQDILDQFDEFKYEKAKSEEDFLDQLRALKDALKQKIGELNAAEEKLLFTEYKLKKLQARYNHKNTQFEALQKTLMELESRMSELQGKLQLEDVDVAKVEPQNLPPPKTREEAVYQRWIQRHDKLVTKLKERLLWAHQQMDYYGQYDIKLSEDKMAILKHEIAELKKELNSQTPVSGAKGEKKEDYELMEERLKDTQERLDLVEKILKEKESQIKELEDQLNGALSNF